MNNSLKNDGILEYEYARKKRVYNRLTLLIHKDTDLLSRLETQKILTGKSFNSLIIEAIEEYLERHEK